MIINKEKIAGHSFTFDNINNFPFFNRSILTGISSWLPPIHFCQSFNGGAAAFELIDALVRAKGKTIKM